VANLVMGPEPSDASIAPGIHIWGWQSDAELWWLHDRAAEMGSVAEIGCLRGRSSFALLTGCPGPVYCIEPWHDPGEHALRGFVEACGHFPNLNMVRGWSPAAAAEVPDVDMAFIDGQHDYDSVAADIKAWLPKARRLIAGHDYSDADGYPGVKQAVDEVFGGRVVFPERTSIWAVWL
jgi:hypothetical protein